MGSGDEGDVSRARRPMVSYAPMPCDGNETADTAWLTLEDRPQTGATTASAHNFQRKLFFRPTFRGEEVGECEIQMPSHFGDRAEEAVEWGRLCAEDARAVCVYARLHGRANSRFRNAGPVGGFKLRRRGS